MAVARAPHGAVDVLPLDLELWTAPGFDANLDELRSRAEARITNLAIAALDRHRYGVDAVIDWNGDYRGGHALAREDVISTIGALARYTSETNGSQLPVPYLPVRLGAATGADAMLYVGGWGYVANHPESTVDKVAGAIAYGMVVIGAVLVVGLVVAAVSHRDGGHHHFDHGGGDEGGVRSGGHGNFSRSRGIGSPLVDATAEVASDVIDAFGRLRTESWRRQCVHRAEE